MYTLTSLPRLLKLFLRHEERRLSEGDGGALISLARSGKTDNFYAGLVHRQQDLGSEPAGTLSFPSAVFGSRDLQSRRSGRHPGGSSGPSVHDRVVEAADKLHREPWHSRAMVGLLLKARQAFCRAKGASSFCFCMPLSCSIIAWSVYTSSSTS